MSLAATAHRQSAQTMRERKVGSRRTTFGSPDQMTPQTRDPESLSVTRGPTESKDKTGTITCNLSSRGRVVAVTHQTTTGMSIHRWVYLHHRLLNTLLLLSIGAPFSTFASRSQLRLTFLRGLDHHNLINQIIGSTSVAL